MLRTKIVAFIMTDGKGGSPTSFSDMDSLSIRDKSLIKRSISKSHNNNFTAGYVPVHEQHLQKTGLRGRKTFAFWTLVGLLFVLAVGNLILTMTILGVLRLGQGMQSLELVPEDSAIKLFGNTDLNDIYKRDGRLEGFMDYPVDIMGYNGSLVVKLAPKNGRAVHKLTMAKNGTVLNNLQSFEVRNEESTIFSTTTPSFNIISKLHNLTTKNSTTTKRLVSPIKSKLQFEAKNINLNGAEGIWMEGSKIMLEADGDIFLRANGSMIFNGKEGTYFDVKKLPIYVPKHSDRVQYKLCICMPQGMLFKIPLNKDSRVYCDHINISLFDPCVAKN